MSTAPRLFGEVIDRTPEMPHWYVPIAKGVLIAGEDMLRAAGYLPGSRRPDGWSPGKPGAFKKACAHAKRDTAGSAAAPAARCRKFRRGSFIGVPSLKCRRRDARHSALIPPALMIGDHFSISAF